MRICFIPIDNRPVCYNLAKDITDIDEDIELLIPPREYLGDLRKKADIEKLFLWLEQMSECDSIVLSLDTLTYGGLIPSRRSEESFEELEERIKKLKAILEKKHAKIYAFSSIMRISNNNFNEEEKEYWSEYGTKIFKYSYELHKNGFADFPEIPHEIINDYLNTRARNFKINRNFLEWHKEGFFTALIFSKDDCAEFGLNVMEAQELEALGGFTKTGADEIPLSLLARAIKKDIKVYVDYTEPDCTDLISNYEDISIDNSVSGQIELCGLKRVDVFDEADFILVVNNFRTKQGELVMGWETEPFNKTFNPPDKPFAVADVRYANGADNAFVEELLKNFTDKFLGYSGWNTSANTLGSLLAEIKVCIGAKNFNNKAFKKLLITRFLDDWAYQANVRGKISEPCDISALMKPFEEKLSKVFETEISPRYIYPWHRKFEIEVVL